ncbi:MAG: VOC family protein [Pirellulales bacterium]|nr:VOC family protein [Pirellulales bacterium]
MNACVIGFEIVSRDPQAAADFYGRLFDWKIGQEVTGGIRRLDAKTAENLHGSILPAVRELRPSVQLVVSVDNVIDTCAHAMELGAAVVVPPRKMPNGQCIAVLVDPQKLPLVVVQDG